MTVNTDLSKRIYTGNGVATDYDYDFKIPLAGDLEVSLFDLDGVELPQVLNTDYTVTGAGGDNGGKVLFTVPPPSGYTILLLSDASYTQPTDFKNQGRFFPETHENAIDRAVILARQNHEAITRSITLPPQVSNVSTQLPVPQASTLFGWNGDGTAIENFPLSTIATQIAYGDKNYQVFSGTGAQVNFTLSQNPGSLGNLDVSIDGVTQVPVTDYTYSGTTLTFAAAPSNGAVIFVRYDVAVPVGTALASAVNFQQDGTGAIVRSSQDKLRDTLDAKDFGVTADGITDETSRMTNAISRARSAALPLRLPAGTIKISSALDISGVTLIGTAKGYRNANGTIIEGSGSHDILTQVNATASDTSIGLHNIRIKGGQWGIKVRYLLHSHWSNVHVTDCANGIQIGNSSDAGPLFNTFDNMETDVTGVGLDVNGNQFANANSFNQCFFTGDQYGARVRCNGGIGAVDNVFNCCEFAGDRYGIDMENTSNTVFNQCYFESLGPSIHFIGARNIGWAANDCVYAKLENTNATGKNAFIYHAGSGTVRGSIKGGYIYLDGSAVHNNLSLVASENVSTFFLYMTDQPERDVAATGFVVLNGLTSANLNINDVGTYTPTWTGSGSNPAIGNGTLSGNYVRSGNQVTVSITMTAGSTTTFGTGDWTFSLPFAAQAQSAGACYILDAGTGYFDGTALVGAGSSSVAVYRNGTATLVGAGVPMAWAQNDSITVTITYRC